MTEKSVFGTYYGEPITDPEKWVELITASTALYGGSVWVGYAAGGMRQDDEPYHKTCEYCGRVNTGRETCKGCGAPL